MRIRHRKGDVITNLGVVSGIALEGTYKADIRCVFDISDFDLCICIILNKNRIQYFCNRCRNDRFCYIGIPSPAYSAEDTIGYLRELAYQAKDYILSDIPLQQTSLMV